MIIYYSQQSFGAQPAISFPWCLVSIATHIILTLQATPQQYLPGHDEWFFLKPFFWGGCEYLLGIRIWKHQRCITSFSKVLQLPFVFYYSQHPPFHLPDDLYQFNLLCFSQLGYSYPPNRGLQNERISIAAYVIAYNICMITSKSYLQITLLL